jgi:hypothetical protein
MKASAFMHQDGIVKSILIEKSDGGVMINKGRRRFRSKAFATSRACVRGEQIRCRGVMGIRLNSVVLRIFVFR